MNDLGVNLHDYGDPDGEPKTFLDVVQEHHLAGYRLVLDHRYRDRNFKPAQDDSPVVGIIRNTPRWIGGEPNFGEPWPESLERFGWYAADALKRHFLEHFFETGDNKHPTLVLHSSGYDSRILSSCLMWFRRQGHDLGQIHFRCHDPEGPTFVQIMQRQGWEPHEYSVFEWPEHDRFDIGLWENPGVSGWLPLTAEGNFWRDLVPYGEEKNFNLIGGSGGGEASEYPTLGKPPTVPWQFCDNRPVNQWLQFFPDGTEVVAGITANFRKVIFPFFGKAHIETISRLPRRFLKYESNGCDMFRAAILRTFDEDTLDIPRAKRTYDWKVSDERWEDMSRKYAASHFYTEMAGPDPSPLFEEMMRNPWVSWPGRIWRLAAVIERAVRG